MIKTVCTSKKPDKLLVAGALESKSVFFEKIAPVFCQLELQDNGPAPTDPILRHAISRFDNPEVDSVNGLSGSPVYNITQNKLSGMVVRGTVKNRDCTLWYIDIYDIVKTLEAVHEGKENPLL